MIPIATWATQNFGSVRLGDARRTKRAVTLVTALGRHPAASFPQACGSWSALKAAYRLLGQPTITRHALSGPHWDLTRQQARAAGVTLLISDLTELDYSAHRATTGLGAIGDGRGRGFFVHTTLAFRPATTQVLGVAAQQT